MGSEMFIGKSEARVDALEKVTGQAKFIADLKFGRTVYARIFRSTQGHARILRLDVERARALPGVRAVVTGADCPARIGTAIQDQYPIARDVVRYWGEPVAVVLASSEQIADQALDLITVDYEPLPVVLYPQEAAKAGAPLLHPQIGEYPHNPVVHPISDSNVAHRYQLRRGSVQDAFAGAHLVVEHEYWVPWIAHVQMEPHGAIALWDGDTFTIWTSSQSPFVARETVAGLYDLSPAKVRVIIPYVGGGFGGKSDVTIEPLMAIAAHAVPGMYVQLVLTREEVFFGTVIGRGAWGRMKTAVDPDGMLLAQEAELYFSAGGYADYSIWISQGGGHNSSGPYYIPNLSLTSHCVYTNTPPIGAYRGYGHPEVHWMVERQMDLIARQLGMDPVELRRRNLLSPGQQNAIGQTMKTYNGKAHACLAAVAAELGTHAEPTAPRRVRGQGLACFMKSPVMRTNAQSGALIRFNEDGSVVLYTGSVELGQGSNTVLSQIAAEVLSLPFEMVRYAPVVDTEYSPHEWQTVASHTTWAVGNAVRMAAEDALAQLKAAAAQVFGIEPQDVEAYCGNVFPRGKPAEGLPYARLVVGYTLPTGQAVNSPIIGRGTFVPSNLTFPDPATGQGNMAASWTFGCQGADVEIDLDSGRIDVLRLVSAQDPGRVINPATAAAQVEGAMVMALGAALMEKLQFQKDGSIRNHSFTDYRILETVDIPEMKVIFLETADATGPFGARGLGEHGIVAVPPAVANAVANALQKVPGLETIDFYEIPITPDRVMQILYPEIEGGGS